MLGMATARDCPFPGHDSVWNSGEISIGSVGHPYECALPCKYFRKAKGCKDGSRCVRCHVCFWRAADKRVKPVGRFCASYTDIDADTTSVPSSTLSDCDLAAPWPAAPLPYSAGQMEWPTSNVQCEPVKIFSDGFSSSEQWSIGSAGHPFSCALPCKYKNRKTGCRGGRQCHCCHLCSWSRNCVPKQPMQMEVPMLDNYIAGAEFLLASNRSSMIAPVF
mmetsp:Transcript_31952/g.72906  ORF Transcript_31952/g.72906 Transcript_31952/m.72906 type:complete len:219 (+) Transcript_31952:73-729(+)